MYRDQGAARTGVVAGSAVALVIAIAGGLLATRIGGDDDPVAAPLPTPTATPEPTPSPTPTPKPPCSTAAKRFLPTSVSFPGGVGSVDVLPLQRDSFNVPGVPPLTSSGKMDMAFDLGNGIRPGDTAGNALLNAHTYPDGSALGNKLLETLHKGDKIVVHGPLGRLCYKVTDRVEVSAYNDGKRYYATDGEPQIAIVVCSGKRLGPGEWTKRTLWFASPETPAAQAI